MKGKITDWEKLSGKVIVLFLIAMLMSYSPGLLRGFFDDNLYPANNTHGIMDDKWEWGFRHYLYFFMNVALFVIQVVRIFKWVFKREEDKNCFPV